MEIIDQMNRTIRLGESPKRIVSLVPSQTELLYHLDCDEEVVGITKFCIHPEEWFRSKTRVGGTKNVNFEKIAELQPDLIIANKEENAQADIEKLCELYPVYISDIFNLEDACQMIADVGQMTGRSEKAKEIVTQVTTDFKNLPSITGTVLYFIWSKPYMVAGDNTFIGFMIKALSLKNAIVDPSMRYQELTEEQIKAINPDYLLLSSEPFPFAEKHVPEFEEFNAGKVVLVDGEMFSWYGSRMLKMKAYFEEVKSAF